MVALTPLNRQGGAQPFVFFIALYKARLVKAGDELGE